MQPVAMSNKYTERAIIIHQAASVRYTHILQQVPLYKYRCRCVYWFFGQGLKKSGRDVDGGRTIK